MDMKTIYATSVYGWCRTFVATKTVSVAILWKELYTTREYEDHKWYRIYGYGISFK